MSAQARARTPQPPTPATHPVFKSHTRTVLSLDADSSVKPSPANNTL